MIMMRFITIIFVLLLSVSSFAKQYKYFLGLKGGMTTLSGGNGNINKFSFQNSYGAVIGFKLKERLLLNLNYSLHKNYNDSTNSSSFSFGTDKSNASMKWQATRLGLTFSKIMGDPSRRLNLIVSFGGGALLWDIKDPIADTVLEVTGIHGETVDFSASELFLTGDLSFNFALSPKWSIDWNFQADYLTGAGLEFEDIVKSERNRWQMGSNITLNFHFGEFISGIKWTSRNEWQNQPAESAVRQPRGIDGDGDGILDEDDRCLNTPTGAVVDRYGCSIDSDNDGVPDGLDDCPATDRRGIGYVDIYGCPVDSDFDGLPDYLDECPTNRTGAHVDEKGCPIDTDADGVPDGIDNCPHTLYGVDVDKFGCIDLSMLSKPMILNIDYPSGSFEIDPYNKERVKDLSRLLLFVKEIRLEINGYTDNIGTTVANKKLSEKRARRVRDYMVILGVESNRIKVFGRGETNFTASNNTAAGRAKNRRIEIVFFK